MDIFHQRDSNRAQQNPKSNRSIFCENRPRFQRSNKTTFFHLMEVCKTKLTVENPLPCPSNPPSWLSNLPSNLNPLRPAQDVPPHIRPLCEPACFCNHWTAHKNDLEVVDSSNFLNINPRKSSQMSTKLWEVDRAFSSCLCHWALVKPVAVGRHWQHVAPCRTPNLNTTPSGWRLSRRAIGAGPPEEVAQVVVQGKWQTGASDHTHFLKPSTPVQTLSGNHGSLHFEAMMRPRNKKFWWRLSSLEPATGHGCRPVPPLLCIARTPSLSTAHP